MSIYDDRIIMLGCGRDIYTIGEQINNPVALFNNIKSSYYYTVFTFTTNKRLF